MNSDIMPAHATYPHYTSFADIRMQLQCMEVQEEYYTHQLT